MRNVYLRPTTAQDIDRQIAKVLKGLGNPAPPLRLEDVRALLKLDRHYYSSNSDGILRETVSRLKVAGKQILRRPLLLLDAIRESELKALYVPDHKMVLLDEEVPPIKQRWSEGHEIIHSIVEWHGTMMLGDDKLTLSLGCHEQIEAEANYGAGRLLFLQGKFESMALDSKPSFASVQAISRTFGNSLTSTLWRCIEILDIPALGMVTQHPKYPDDRFDPDNPCRYFISSKRFAGEFSNVTEKEAFAIVRGVTTYKKGGPIAGGDVVLTNDRGESHVFSLETFFNRHEALTFIIHKKPCAPLIAVSSAPACEPTR